MAEDEDAARVILRELAAADEGEFLELARASVGLHHPWYTMATTPEAFQAYLARLSRPTTEGRLVCLRDGGAMAGVIVVDSIIRGRFQSGSISYGAFASAAGRGDMSEGLALIDGAWRNHERWAITAEMTGLPPVDPHPTRPTR